MPDTNQSTDDSKNAEGSEAKSRAERKYVTLVLIIVAFSVLFPIALVVWIAHKFSQIH